VADGLAATAKVITAAAAIMVVVFGSFILETERVIKLMGTGLATAILLDATIVRMLLVPATMELLGDKNWWLPRWLDRLLPNIDVEGHACVASQSLDQLPTSMWRARRSSSSKAAALTDLGMDPFHQAVGSGGIHSSSRTCRPAPAREAILLRWWIATCWVASWRNVVPNRLPASTETDVVGAGSRIEGVTRSARLSLRSSSSTSAASGTISVPRDPSSDFLVSRSVIAGA
jgi:hypothetical protein